MPVEEEHNEFINRAYFREAHWYDEEMDEEDILIAYALDIEAKQENVESQHELKYGVPDWLHDSIEELYQSYNVKTIPTK